MNNITKTILGLIVALVAVWGIYTITQKSSEPTTNEVIKIGGLFGLTGYSDVWGVHEKNAAELAIRDINSSDGINGKKIKFIVEDSQSNLKQAVSATQKLINLDHVPVIIGPTWCEFYEVVAPITEEKQVILFSASGISTTGEDLGPYSFSLSVDPSYEGKVMAEFVLQKYPKNIAIVQDQNVFAELLAQSFKTKAEELSLNVSEHLKKVSGDNDFRTDITKMKNKGIDLVYLILGDNANIPIFLRQAKELGFDSVITSYNVISVMNFKENKEIWENIYFPVEKDTTKGFTERYKKEFNSNPSFSAVRTYDVVQILAKVMKGQTEITAENIKNALSKLKFYDGISGHIEFNEAGYRSKAIYELMTIKDGNMVLVK